LVVSDGAVEKVLDRVNCIVLVQVEFLGGEVVSVVKASEAEVKASEAYVEASKAEVEIKESEAEVEVKTSEAEVKASEAVECSNLFFF
jgi:hypothetical protein